jgi:glycosyltransferase involved in cell wall biosynthesis
MVSCKSLRIDNCQLVQDAASGMGPHSLLKFEDRRLPAGWYRFKLEALSVPRLRSVKLLPDFGEGFKDERSVEFVLQSEFCESVLVRFPSPVRQIAFAAPGLATLFFEVRSVSLESVTFVEVVRALVARFLAMDSITSEPPRARAMTSPLRSSASTESHSPISEIPEKLKRLTYKVGFGLFLMLRSAGKLLVPGLTSFSERTARPIGPEQPSAYPDWITKWDTLSSSDIEKMRRKLQRFERGPLISVVMTTFNTPSDLLEESLDSVIGQIYPRWELCIADDASSEGHVRSTLEDYAKREPRIKLALRQENGDISEASNSALELVEGEYVAFMDHDDVIRPHALFRVAEALNEDPDIEFLYSDEDKIVGAGTVKTDESGSVSGRYDPFFKPDWNPDLFLSHNYINHLVVIKTALVRLVGGFRKEYDGSQDYDLLLRVLETVEPERIKHLPYVLYHWRARAGSTALGGSEKPVSWLAGKRALEAHFARLGQSVIVTSSPAGSIYRRIYPLPPDPPLVSIIIPTRDKLSVLKPCVESVSAKTTYPNYEILIVDNNSHERSTIEYLDQLARQNSKVRVLRFKEPFNYSAINNFAVSKARGSIIALLNNDIVIITPDWLQEMVSHAIRPEIGAVGAKLLYPDGTLQHGGVITGLGGCAGHAQKHLRKNAPGYFHRAVLVHNVSAVTGACLVVERKIFEQLGGLDEKYLTIAFNDIDLCLKIRQAGYRNLWTPFAEMYHYESMSRGPEDTLEKVARHHQEVATMQQRWGTMLWNDPAYSPILTLEREDFAIASVPRVFPLAVS